MGSGLGQMHLCLPKRTGHSARCLKVLSVDIILDVPPVGHLFLLYFNLYKGMCIYLPYIKSLLVKPLGLKSLR